MKSEVTPTPPPLAGAVTFFSAPRCSITSHDKASIGDTGREKARWETEEVLDGCCTKKKKNINPFPRESGRHDVGFIVRGTTGLRSYLLNRRLMKQSFDLKLWKELQPWGGPDIFRRPQRTGKEKRPTAVGARAPRPITLFGKSSNRSAACLATPRLTFIGVGHRPRGSTVRSSIQRVPKPKEGPPPPQSPNFDHRRLCFK